MSLRFHTLASRTPIFFNNFKTIIFVDGSVDDDAAKPDQIGTACVIRNREGDLIDFSYKTYTGHRAMLNIRRLNQHCELLALINGIEFAKSISEAKGLKGPFLFITDSQTTVENVEKLMSSNSKYQPKKPYKTQYYQIIQLLNEMPSDTELRWVDSDFNNPSHWLSVAARRSGLSNDEIEDFEIAMRLFYRSLYKDLFLFRLSSSTVQGLQVFTFNQLNSATSGFSKSNIIRQGAFGSVYRGVLTDAREVAIKLMDHGGKHGEEEFKMEVELLSRLHSPYLLRLVGYCSDSNHRLLVYEFMANGNLQEHLYPARGSNAFACKLDWETRLKIAVDAAKGLEYLHMSPPVIHRDFKSSNILLDKDFHAKLSDFGLAKLGPEKAGGHVSTRVLGTQGYVAPEYALTGHLTTKSDVYSYGVVLLELLTGRVPVDMKRPQGEGVLVSWALPRLTDRERVIQIMDPALEGQYSMKAAIQVAAIAAMCVQPEADYRPLMADVVQSLVPLVKLNKSTSNVGSCSSFNALMSPIAVDNNSKSNDTVSTDS